MVFIGACSSTEKVAEEYYPNESHEKYAETLAALDLDATEMGRQWITAGDPSSNPAALSLLPFQERRIFDPAVPGATYYLIEGLKGQAVTIDIETDSDAGYFADLFGLDEDFYPEGPPEAVWDERTFEKVAAARETPTGTGARESAAGSDAAAETAGPDISADSDMAAPAEGEKGKSEALAGSSRIVFEPRKHRFYLLRVQPRLLEGGEFLITFNSDPLLSWPMPDGGIKDVQSFFGAPRDGGDRVHHGIDIFAPRGTPLLAVDDTTIYRIQVRERGGNTVFLRDEERGLVYYYAHLDEWAEDIEEGMQVPEGMELGTVGNTGNAVWSPPHLHFGIYQTSWRGALDPWYFFIDVEDLPEYRRAMPFDTQGLNQSSADSEDSPLYRTYASRSLFVPSPAVSDRDGEALSERGKPVMRTEWQEESSRAPGALRLVASRADAYGFMDSERRIWWLPYNPS